MDVYYAVKKARQEIKEIRRRYAAKKAGCVIQGTDTIISAIKVKPFYNMKTAFYSSTDVTRGSATTEGLSELFS